MCDHILFNEKRAAWRRGNLERGRFFPLEHNQTEFSWFQLTELRKRLCKQWNNQPVKFQMMLPNHMKGIVKKIDLNGQFGQIEEWRWMRKLWLTFIYVSSKLMMKQGVNIWYGGWGYAWDQEEAFIRNYQGTNGRIKLLNTGMIRVKLLVEIMLWIPKNGISLGQTGIEIVTRPCHNGLDNVWG